MGKGKNKVVSDHYTMKICRGCGVLALSSRWRDWSALHQRRICCFWMDKRIFSDKAEIDQSMKHETDHSLPFNSKLNLQVLCYESALHPSLCVFVILETSIQLYFRWFFEFFILDIYIEILYLTQKVLWFL